MSKDGAPLLTVRSYWLGSVTQVSHYVVGQISPRVLRVIS